MARTAHHAARVLRAKTRKRPRRRSLTKLEFYQQNAQLNDDMARAAKSVGDSAATIKRYENAAAKWRKLARAHLARVKPTAAGQSRFARNGKRRMHRNPKSPLYGARSRKQHGAHGAAHLIGLEVYEIRYRHATDGKDYKHPFETGVLMLGMPDGSLKIESATGVKLWEEINV